MKNSGREHRVLVGAFSGARFDGVRETRENLSGGGARGLVLTVLTELIWP